MFTSLSFRFIHEAMDREFSGDVLPIRRSPSTDYATGYPADWSLITEGLTEPDHRAG